MGVPFARDYEHIHQELTEAICQIEDVYRIFEMDSAEWSGIDLEEQHDCVKTLADDLFYGLGSEPEMQVGQGIVAYDRDHHVIRVSVDDKVVHIIYLV